MVSTPPKISYGQGYLFDCDTAYTTRVDSADPLSTPSLTVLNEDVFDIVGTCDNVADEYCYYQSADLTSLGISTTIYPDVLIRYKTDVSSNGLKAMVKIEYTDAVVETVLSAFSTAWSVRHHTPLTAGKTVKYIRFYADDDPNTIAAGTFHTYYDFIMFCKGIFTFPFVSDTTHLSIPINDGDSEIAGRVGDSPANSGSPSAQLSITGEIDSRTSWQGANAITAEVLYDLAHNTYREPFQWFSSDLCDMKAKILAVDFDQTSNKEALRTFTMLLKEYRWSSGSNEAYYDRFGLLCEAL